MSMFKSDISNVIDHHEITDGNATRTSEITGISLGSVLRIWRSHDFEIREPGKVDHERVQVRRFDNKPIRSLPNGEIERIFRSFASAGGSYAEGARITGYSNVTVKKYYQMLLEQGFDQYF